MEANYSRIHDWWRYWWRRRRLPWRSDLLNQLVLHLDKRYEISRNVATRTKPRENRRIANLSARKQPIGAPKWAVKMVNAEDDQIVALVGHLAKRPPSQPVPKLHRNTHLLIPVILQPHLVLQRNLYNLQRISMLVTSLTVRSMMN